VKSFHTFCKYFYQRLKRSRGLRLGRPFAWRSGRPPNDTLPWPFGPGRRYSPLPIAYGKVCGRGRQLGGAWLGGGSGVLPRPHNNGERNRTKKPIDVSLILNVQTHPLSPITAIPSHRQRPTMKHQKKQKKETNERANIETSQAGT